MTTASAETLSPRSDSAPGTERSAGAAVTLHFARRIRRGALLVGLAAAGMSAVVAGQYQTTFAGELNGAALRALAENPAIRILFGPPVALDDPGGFTVWRTGTPVQILTGVWALLAATRLTRGEEDSGRAEMLLAGRVRAIDPLTRVLAVLGAASALIAAAVAVALLVTGTQPVGAVIHAAGLFGVTMTFAAAGAFAGQLMPSRAAATGLAVAALGAGLFLRMLADGVSALSWASWATPFGLTANAAPYADNRIVPLLVLVVFPALLTTAAVIACSHRDVGRGVLNPSGRRRPRVRLLGSVTGFAARRAARPTAAWSLAIGAYFLLVGVLIASILRFMRENPRFAELATAAGFGGLGTAEGFAAAMFSLLTIPVGLYAATRVAAFAAAETDRRLTPLLALPLSRRRIVLTELLLTGLGVLVLLAVAGLTLWCGATIADAPLDLTAALAGTANVAPVALLALGTAALALGWAPRAVAALGALPVAGGFLLTVILQSTQGPAWLTYLSPYTYLASVPGTPPDWGATTSLLLVSGALIVLGVLGYQRRDLNT
ncbi:polyketide antibiotic transporter [Amycolatopsis keratiniphila]|uniref:polyketide antibiotic transporter n=1 Tax=Amycolatopsis keratiniphila TaxID=129921 RepID=UPI000879A9CF|nr:polyketide antibiotic transporter [Amycolatopsis keratiniphila]OLZ48121.1 polyketide antibiotic transporter [Amycolatopsis keratiniphila subsp. nogabecina]SDU26309.1 ABC-2 type transport system permease protein [Amycolatopsis keratiniphila]